MRTLASILGIAIMLVVLLDAFEAMVLPRRATRKYRPARYYYRAFWYVWVHVADRIKRRGWRQHFLSTLGTLSLPPIALPEVPVDNWQKSPWQERAPGIGSLRTANPGDHFS